MLLAWADRTEQAITTWPDTPTADNDRAALARIAACLAEFPTGP
jgi:hypothetical protein